MSSLNDLLHLCGSRLVFRYLCWRVRVAHGERRCQVLPTAVFPVGFSSCTCLLFLGWQPLWGPCNVMRRRFVKTQILHLFHCTFFCKPGCPETLGPSAFSQLISFFDVDLMHCDIQGGRALRWNNIHPLHLLVCCAYLSVLRWKGWLFEGGLEGCCWATKMPIQKDMRDRLIDGTHSRDTQWRETPVKGNWWYPVRWS